MANESKISITAEDKASAVINQITEDLNRMADTGERIEFLAVAFGSVLAAIEAVQLVSAKLVAPINAYVEWQSAVDGLTDSQLAYIDALQKSVGISDVVAADLLGLAEAYGIVADKQDDVVTASVGLAETLGTNVNSVLLKLSDFLQGNDKALDSLIPQLRDMSTASEKLAEIERLATAGLEKKNEAMSDLEGAQLRYEHALDRMTRIIGEAAAPAVTALLNVMSALANAIGNVLHDAMDLLHRDFLIFTNDFLDAAKITEFFELTLLSLEKTFIQLNRAFATLLDLAGIDMTAFLEEVELRLRDIDRRADQAIDRRIANQQNRGEDDTGPPFGEILFPKIPKVPDFGLNNAAGAGLSSGDKGTDELNAFESRLLTRGPVREQNERQMVVNLEKIAKAAAEIVTGQRTIVETIVDVMRPDPNKIEAEVVN